MALSINKLAPTGVVLAFAGFCVWPSVSELISDPPKKTAKKMPELATTLFSPTLATPPTRNPFFPKTEEEVATNEAPSGPNRSSTRTRATAVKAVEPPLDPRRGLHLDATCLQGDRWQVMISGHVFTSQNTSTKPDDSFPELKIIRVLPYKVVLEREGQVIDLTYTDSLSRSTAPALSTAAPVSTPPASKEIPPDPEIQMPAPPIKKDTTESSSDAASVAKSSGPVFPPSTDN